MQGADKKTQQRRRRRQKALRRFLAMSAMIGREYAPDFNGADPQGVHWDSLASFKVVGAQEVPDRAGVQEPQPWFLHFEASHPCGMVWNEQRGPQHPFWCEKIPSNCRTHTSVAG